MDIKLPQLGEGADSGNVVKILVKEGDRIEKDGTLIELENEKAVASIPSTVAGTVSKIHVKEGDTISVGDAIASVDEEGEESPADDAQGGAKESEEEAPEKKEKPEPKASGAPRKEQTPARAHAESSFDTPAAPSVRNIARRLGIDLSRVQGSARGGRVLWEDLRDYIAWLQNEVFGNEKSERSGREDSEKTPEVDFSKWGSVRTEKLSATRKSIGRKMAQSWRTVPHVTQFGEADITGLMELKKKHDAAYEKKGARLTLTAFFLKALVPALEEHPVFKASLTADGENVVFKDYCHISVAVDTEGGLLAPVLRDVDTKSLLELSRELGELAEKARARKISTAEMQGGCFTISNLGGIGGAHFTPVINQPESAILGAGRGQWLPRVIGKNKKIEPRLIVPLGLSYDHRLIDGAAGARFIVTVSRQLEEFPEKWIRL